MTKKAKLAKRSKASLSVVASKKRKMGHHSRGAVKATGERSEGEVERVGEGGMWTRLPRGPARFACRGQVIVSVDPSEANTSCRGPVLAVTAGDTVR